MTLTLTQFFILCIFFMVYGFLVGVIVFAKPGIPKKDLNPYDRLRCGGTYQKPIILKAKKAVPFDDVIHHPKESEIWAKMEVKRLLTDNAANYVTIWTEKDDITGNFIITGQLIIYDGGEHNVD